MTTRAVADDLGHVNQLPTAPSRLVSLVPNLSELLWWWHLADRVVGVTDFCTAPPRAFGRARRVRGTKNPDVAAVIDLAPTLVVASEEENRELDVRRLRDAGIAVHVVRVRRLADLPTSLDRLADALGVGAAGAELAARIARAVDGVRPRRARSAVCPIWRDDPERGGDEEGWWVVGRDTFAADLLAAVGLEVRPAAPEERYPRLRFGELTALAPDVVLLPDEPYAFGPGDLREVRAAGLRARAVDGTALWWWGPRTPSAVGDLAELRRGLDRRAAARPG